MELGVQQGRTAVSIEPDRDQVFMYPTIVIVGLTLLVCACYGLVFVNPNANPIRWLRPPVTPPVLGFQQLPATWTPTPLPTATPTYTPTDTPTNTPTNTPTEIPTNTPTETNTPLPTSTFTPLPTATRRPPTAVPPTEPPPPPANTPAPVFPWVYYPAYYRCEHSGGTFIHVIVGTAWGAPTEGITTRLSTSSDPNVGFIDDADTNSEGDATHVLSVTGRPPKVGTYYAWLVDKLTKQRISDVSPGIMINGKKENAADSCWQAYVYFGPSVP